MTLKVTAPGTTDKNQNEGYVNGRQDHVGNQDREVDSACPVVMRVGDRANLRVVDQVGDQKQNRGREGADHPLTVAVTVTSADLPVAHEKKKSTQRVECGVQGG